MAKPTDGPSRIKIVVSVSMLIKPPNAIDCKIQGSGLHCTPIERRLSGIRANSDIATVRGIAACPVHVNFTRLCKNFYNGC